MERLKSSNSMVAVVTGANSGVGFALCQKLLETFPEMKLCLCCRNKERAEKAADELRASSSRSEISVVLLDTSDIQSVYRAAQDIRSKYEHIDLLYLNAGGFEVVGVDWMHCLKTIFTTKMPHMIKTGEGLLIHKDNNTQDGLRQVFETNVFGHYVMVNELKGLLERGVEVNGCPAQAVWTSSRNGFDYNFSLDDIQHRNGKEPYSSSKYAVKMASVGLNERLNSKNIYSHAVCPGTVNSPLVQTILPGWVWAYILIPFLCMVRFLIDSHTCSPENGCIAQYWLCQQDPSSLSPKSFFVSCCDCYGKPYVRQEKMEISTKDALNLLSQMDDLLESLTL